MDQSSEARRKFVKRAAYVAPAILTLQAAPSYAKSGSEKPGKGGKKDKAYGNSAVNDVNSTTGLPPSSPGPTA
jgi:hypothetical protein